MVNQVGGDNAHYTPSSQSRHSSISQEASTQKHWSQTQILNEYFNQCKTYHRIFIQLVNRLEHSL